jgi:hypothetical protein
MPDQHYWTWRGTYFGYRSGDNLFTHRGKHIGKFHADEVYGVDGRYLGEVRNAKFLITNRSKRSWRKSSFGPLAGGSYAPYANYAGYAMYAGYDDFPSPSDF